MSFGITVNQLPEALFFSWKEATWLEKSFPDTLVLIEKLQNIKWTGNIQFQTGLFGHCIDRGWSIHVMCSLSKLNVISDPQMMKRTNFPLPSIDVWADMQSMFGIFASSGCKRHGGMQWQQSVISAEKLLAEWPFPHEIHVRPLSFSSTWLKGYRNTECQYFQSLFFTHHLQNALKLVPTHDKKFHLTKLASLWKNHCPLPTSETASI